MLVVQRPTGTWVGFGPELDGIARYISDVVIPTLVTGAARPDGLPTNIDLGDTGATLAQGVERVGTVRAHDRANALVADALRAANELPLRPIPTSDPIRDGA